MLQWKKNIKGNYYSIYSIIFHIEICTSLFELFSIKKPHDYRGADSLKQTLFLWSTQNKTQCFNTSQFTRVCPVLSVKLHRKYLSSLQCSCQFPLSLVLPLTCLLPVCNTDVKRNGTFLLCRFAPCVHSHLPTAAAANVSCFCRESHTK